MRAVRFDEYGPVSVLNVREVDDPVAATGELVVAVKAAGINPGEARIREGELHARWPASFPSGEGSDLAGQVVAVGAEVSEFGVGDEVIGFTNARVSHAELVAIPATQAIARPAGVAWEVGGALFVAGTTAYAMLEAVGLRAGETVLIAGASGGVGVFAVQLAARRGARVIGVASARNGDWLEAHGVERVDYGDGLEARIRLVADPANVDAVLDCHGDGYVELGLALGVAPERIDTIADFEAPIRHPGVRTDGNAQGARAEVLSELAELVTTGELEVPIAARFPLEQVQAAYTALANDHPLGKIVLVP